MRQQHESSECVSHPEDGDSIFLQKIGTYQKIRRRNPEDRYKNLLYTLKIEAVYSYDTYS
jgi:hypothetical protein